MKTFVNSLVLYIVLTGHGFAQTKEKAIESNLSSYQLRGLLGADRTTKSMDDYKGKLVILDFWFTACASCIAAMPRMQELQDKYKDRLQIIFVNDLAKDDETAVNKIRQNFRKRTGLPLTIPFLLKDSVLTDEYFPHRGDPFEVWIDQTGKVIATTGGDQVTEENILKALKGVKMDVSMRKDLLTFNRDEPLFINGNGENKEGMIYHSVIAKFTDGLGGFQGIIGDQDSIWGYKAINTWLIDLYARAYSELDFSRASKFVYQTPDSSEIKYSLDDPTHAALYCYDLRIPKTPSSQETREKIFTTYLRDDLSRTFPFTFKKEKRSFDCLIVRKNDKIVLKKKQAYSSQDENFSLNDIAKNKGRYLHNASFDEVASHLGQRYHIDCIDESGVKGDLAIDLDFPPGFNFQDFEALKKFLSAKGIEISKEKRTLDVVVVGDRKEGESTVLN